MPIIVGTITVNVGRCSRSAFIAATGSYIGKVTTWPPDAGTQIIEIVEAA